MGTFGTIGSLVGSYYGPVGSAVGGAVGSAIDGDSSEGSSASGSSYSGITNPISGFSTSGVTGSYDKASSGYNVASTDERQSLIQQIVDSLNTSASEVSSYSDDITGAYDTALTGTQNLLDSVALGESESRKAQLAALESSRESALSSLTENLATRRLSGSSFGANSATQANLAYNEQADQIIAESFLSEMEQTNTYLTQQLDQSTAKINAELENFLTSEALTQAASQEELDEQEYLTSLATSMAQVATQSATALYQSDLNQTAEEASAFGSLIGSTDWSSMFGDSSTSSMSGDSSTSSMFGDGWSSSPSTSSNITWN